MYTAPSSIDTDVVIVGAGPGGLATAIRLGQLGVRKVIILDRQNFPRDKICGSAVTPIGIQILKKLAVFDTIAPQSHWVRGVRFEFPRRKHYRLSCDIMVCVRRVFDQLLLDRADAVGAKFIPNFQVKELITCGDRVFGVRGANGEEIIARYTVIANGVHSKFVPENGRRPLLRTVMGWWETEPGRHDELEVVYDPMVKPFYGWQFPEGPTRVNIGIGYEDPDGSINGRDLFKAFLDRHYGNFICTARQIGPWKGQPISYSFKIRKLTSPGRIVVGEAGRIVDPITGEGIYHALHSGVLAAETLCRLLRAETNSGRLLKEYEAECRGVFNRSLRLGRLIKCYIRYGGLEMLSLIPKDFLVGVYNRINISHPSLDSVRWQ